MMKEKLKKIDKFLDLRTYLDGYKKVVRQSPFNINRVFDIIHIKNQYIGSGNWLIAKLRQMDNQRFNIVGRVADKNRMIYKSNHNNKYMHKDIADFMTTDIV